MTETHTPLPCPFCGSGPARKSGRYTQASFSGVEMQTLSEDHHYVWCGTCGAQGSPEATEAEALTAWNTRAVNSHHRLVEALEALAKEFRSKCRSFDNKKLHDAEDLLAAVKEAGRG